MVTWVHYRGWLIIVLLAAGNFSVPDARSCSSATPAGACAAVSRWPRRLRTKWIGVALFVAVLFAYELFDLWALPRATA